MLKVLQQGDALRWPKRPLAAPSEMLHQTAAYVPVDLPVSRDRISDRKVGRPTLHLPVEVADQYRDRLETLLTVRPLMRLLPLLLQRLLRAIQVQVLSGAAFQGACEPSRQ